jgi:hypothetical protein
MMRFFNPDSAVCSIEKGNLEPSVAKSKHYCF